MFIGGRKFLIDVYFLAKPDFLGGVVVLDVAGMQHLAFASIPAPQKMALESFNFLTFAACSALGNWSLCSK